MIMFAVIAIGVNRTVGPRVDSMVYFLVFPMNKTRKGSADVALNIRPAPSTVRTARTLGTAVAALSALAVLASCTSAVGERINAADGDAVDGGTVRIGASTDLSPKTLYSGINTAERAVIGNVFENLTRYDHDSLDPRPVLAESWETDDTTVTVNLQDDVSFHNGESLDSQDVKASFENYADPERAGQLARTAGQIEDIGTPDPLTVEFTFGQPINNIFDLFEHVPIIEDSTLDGFNAGTDFTGTGPYSFDHWDKGNSFSLDSFDDHHDGGPQLDGIEVVVVPDSQTQFAQLRSGQLDVLPEAAPRDAEALGDNDLFTVFDTPGTGDAYYAGFNVDSPTFADKRVRQAVALTMDRDRILEEVYQGRGVTQSLPWSEDSPAYDREKNDTYQRDVDRARDLVAAVEDENGPLPQPTLNYRSGSSTEQNNAQIIAANLAEIGIDLTLEPLENGVQLEKLRNSGFSDMWLLGHGFGQFVPSTLTVSAFPFNSEKNASNFQDHAYSAAAQDAWTTGDAESPEAHAAYDRLNDILLDEAFLVELLRPDTPIVTTSTLHDVQWGKRGELTFANAYFTE